MNSTYFAPQRNYDYISYCVALGENARDIDYLNEFLLFQPQLVFTTVLTGACTPINASTLFILYTMLTAFHIRQLQLEYAWRGLRYISRMPDALFAPPDAQHPVSKRKADHQRNANSISASRLTGQLAADHAPISPLIIGPARGAPP